ncbi:MAG: cation:proton antiporter, partial [Holophaga sp.]|nr:cation:proton antiporter [Holophaga sp.]
IVGISVGLAYLVSILFNVSFALGAFLAGALVNGQPISHRIQNNLQPLQDTFSVLFFVSVGMLFDPRVLIQHPIKVLWVLGIILIGKTVAAFLLMRLMRFGKEAALVVSAGLAQIGEFSFILASLATSVGLLSKDGYQLIIAGSIISIALNPSLFLGAAKKKPLKV